MEKEHNFSFEVGEILRKITAWWLVSYMYYQKIDKTHDNWYKNITENSINTRKSNFNKSKGYHKDWLIEITQMTDLEKPKNSANLSGDEIKDMARKLIEEW